MTCIAALKDREGTVWMGGDRCCSSNGRVWTQATPKVVKLDWMIVGSAGSNAAGNELLCRQDEIPRPTELNQDPFNYLHRELSPWLWKRGDENRTNYTKDGSHTQDISLLVGMAGRIFSIDQIGGVLETTEPYFAIGAGRDLATGAMTACFSIWEIRNELSPELAEKALRLALEIAAKHTDSTAPPFDILQLKRTP